MRMRSRWLVAALALLLAAGVGWYAESPAWTLKQMAGAARAGDADRLSAYIDYPELRASTKAQLKAAMSARLTSGSPNGFEALGLMMGVSMADRMIDRVLSPEGMEAMFAAGKAAAAAKPAAKKPFGLDANNREIVRDGFDSFRLHEKGKAGEDGDLVFERHGLGWKLAGIELPAGLFDAKK